MADSDFTPRPPDEPDDIPPIEEVEAAPPLQQLMRAALQHGLRESVFTPRALDVPPEFFSQALIQEGEETKRRDERRALEERNHHHQLMTFSALGFSGLLAILFFAYQTIVALAPGQPEVLKDLIGKFFAFIGGSGFGSLVTYFVQVKKRNRTGD